MNRNARFLSLSVLACFLAAGIFSAHMLASRPAPDASAAVSEMMSASGKVTGVTDNGFSLEIREADQPRTLNFVTDASTKIEGRLEVGVQASVDYRVEDQKNVATTVKVQQ